MMARIDQPSALMLAGLAAVTAAVWIWGDSGIYGVRVAPVPAKPAVVAAAAIEKVSLPTAAPEVAGTATAVDSATLRIGGKTLPLAGLKPVGHRQALAAFGDFLASAGQLACRTSGEGWICAAADGTDIGEVAVLSGLAFTGSGASQRYLDAEKDARLRKAGIWGAR
jgi:hypothetical protein